MKDYSNYEAAILPSTIGSGAPDFSVYRKMNAISAESYSSESKRTPSNDHLTDYRVSFSGHKGRPLTER